MNAATPLRMLRRGIISGPRFTSVVQGLPSIVPFVSPEEQERARGAKFAVRLGANESIFGPSPRAIEAMRDAAAGAWMYGDPKSHHLREALAALHGVEPTNLVVGEGIDGLLSYVAGLLVGPGDPVVTTLGTYPTFNYFVAGRGGVLHTVPYGADDRQDLGALAAKAAEVQAKVLYVVNPDNPSGTAHSAAAIEALVEGLPPGTLLVLDEAYSELAPAGFVPRVAADDLRVVRLRTFSKGYGLAGARIGYALGATEIVSAFDKIRNHFGIGRIGQAGALAALDDRPYLESVVERVCIDPSPSPSPGAGPEPGRRARARDRHPEPATPSPRPRARTLSPRPYSGVLAQPSRGRRRAGRRRARRARRDRARQRAHAAAVGDELRHDRLRPGRAVRARAARRAARGRRLRPHARRRAARPLHTREHRRRARDAHLPRGAAAGGRGRRGLARLHVAPVLSCRGVTHTHSLTRGALVSGALVRRAVSVHLDPRKRPK